MKRLLIGSFAALVISMPLYAQNATSPDSSVGTGTSMNQGAGSMDQGIETDQQRMEETTPAAGGATVPDTTRPGDQQRMEETTPAAGDTTTSPDSTRIEDQQRMEETRPSDLELQEEETTSPEMMEDTETQFE